MFLFCGDISIFLGYYFLNSKIVTTGTTASVSQFPRSHKGQACRSMQGPSRVANHPPPDYGINISPEDAEDAAPLLLDHTTTCRPAGKNGGGGDGADASGGEAVPEDSLGEDGYYCEGRMRPRFRGQLHKYTAFLSPVWWGCVVVFRVPCAAPPSHAPHARPRASSSLPLLPAGVEARARIAVSEPPLRRHRAAAACAQASAPGLGGLR